MNDQLFATICNEEKQVQKTLDEIFNNNDSYGSYSNNKWKNRKKQRRRNSNDSQLSMISNESEQSNGPLISIPTSEFCSLNMRLLERNNEVKLAMETATQAERKLIEYRKSADQAMEQLKRNWLKLQITMYHHLIIMIVL